MRSKSYEENRSKTDYIKRNNLLDTDYTDFTDSFGEKKTVLMPCNAVVFRYSYDNNRYHLISGDSCG